MKTLHIAIAAVLFALPVGAPLRAEEQTELPKQAPSAPPVAEKREHSFTHHGVTLSDPYNWLRDQSYPTVDDKQVLDHLRAENAWFEARMAPHKDTVETLSREMRGRIK